MKRRSGGGGGGGEEAEGREEMAELRRNMGDMIMTESDAE